MIIAIGDKYLCQQAKSKFNAIPTKLADPRIYQADTILLFNVSIEAFRKKYPEVFYEADILVDPSDPHLITSTPYPKHQLQRLPVSLVYGPECVNLHQPVVFSNHKSKYVSADEFKPLSKAESEKEVWFDETITHHLNPKELYKLFEKTQQEATLIVDDENQDAYERYFGLAIPIKQKQ